jgi:hypothetical protein
VGRVLNLADHLDKLDERDVRPSPDVPPQRGPGADPADHVDKLDERRRLRCFETSLSDLLNRRKFVKPG